MNEGTPTPRKRRRPALSCVQCRRRKIKCDRNFPCGQCEQSKSATACFYSPDDAPSPAVHPADAVNVSPASSSSRITGLGSLERASNSALLKVAGSPATRRSSCSSPGTVSELSLQGAHPESTVQDPKGRIHKPDQLSGTVGRLAENSGNALSLPETAPSIRGSLSKSRFFGQSHWMTILEQV